MSSHTKLIMPLHSFLVMFIHRIVTLYVVGFGEQKERPPALEAATRSQCSVVLCHLALEIKTKCGIQSMAVYDQQPVSDQKDKSCLAAQRCEDRPAKRSSNTTVLLEGVDDKDKNDNFTLDKPRRK